MQKKLEKYNIIVNGFLKLGGKSDVSQKLYNKKTNYHGCTIEYLRNISFKEINTVDERVLCSNQKSYEQLNSYIDSIDLSLPFLNYLETNVVDHCNLNVKDVHIFQIFMIIIMLV